MMPEGYEGHRETKLTRFMWSNPLWKDIPARRRPPVFFIMAVTMRPSKRHFSSDVKLADLVYSRGH